MITGKVKDVNIDQNGNVRVVTDYFDENNVLVHPNGVTRYSFSSSDNLIDMISLIEKDVKDHASYLITKKHTVSRNASEIDSLKSLIVGNEYASNTGVMFTRTKKLVVNENSVISQEDRTNL